VKISEDQVRYVADLAHLRLTEAEVARMALEMGEILTHIDKLNELDTEGVAPMAQVLYDAGETATLRADVEGRTLGNEDALANAPDKARGFFRVPKVVER
jgi:aspartyl-tRNA(Asn)/glutamyl-tRNA(Gln) amidotransferase subunit C